MASKLAMLAKLADFKDLGLGGSEETKEPPSEKELKDEEKRKLALEQAEKERKKRHQKEEYQREKVRDNIRQKYGIQKPQAKTDKKKAVIDEVVEEYGLDADSTRELNARMQKDAEERAKSRDKIDKKMDRRRQKKEMKEKCQVQWFDSTHQ